MVVEVESDQESTVDIGLEVYRVKDVKRIQEFECPCAVERPVQDSTTQYYLWPP